MDFHSVGTCTLTVLLDSYTHSIDLSHSWTNVSVEISQIPKGAPLLDYGALWTDQSQDTIYAYDGGISKLSYQPGDQLPGNQLWALKTSGDDGSGNAGGWQQVQTTGNFSTLSAIQQGSYTSGNDLGFAFGGYQWTPGADATSFGVEDYLPGIIMYNMTSQSWFNVTGGFDYQLGSRGEASHYVPTFGPAGLVLLFGGERADSNNDLSSFVSFDNVFVYEPLSQRWDLQAVTGDKPPPSQAPCVAGVQGDNGTYEVSMHR